MTTQSPTLFKTKTVPQDMPIVESKKKTTCKSCFGILFHIMIVIAFVIWEIFAIIALVKNPLDNIQEVCSDSYLWVALLIVCIMTGLNMILDINKKASDNKDEKKNKASLISSCFGLGVFIWLCVELTNDCVLEKLTNSQVYLMSSIYFYMVIGLAGLLVLIILVILIIACISSCCNKKEPVTPKGLDLV